MNVQRLFRMLKHRLAFRLKSLVSSTGSVYWDSGFADELEDWGQDHVWLEIQALLAGRSGRVLDIACGSGQAIQRLQQLPGLTVYGSDFSNLLINRGKANGLAGLVVCDAKWLPFPDHSFDYSYSIGSLEHFHEDGIEQFLVETRRVTRQGSFHMIPVSRGKDHGWISSYQPYYNNSLAWWMPRFKQAFRYVYTLPSGWSALRSIGKWIVCIP